MLCEVATGAYPNQAASYTRICIIGLFLCESLTGRTT